MRVKVPITKSMDTKLLPVISYLLSSSVGCALADHVAAETPLLLPPMEVNQDLIEQQTQLSDWLAELPADPKQFWLKNCWWIYNSDTGGAQLMKRETEQSCIDIVKDVVSKSGDPDFDPTEDDDYFQAADEKYGKGGSEE